MNDYADKNVKIQAVLDEALADAKLAFDKDNQAVPDFGLSEKLRNSLDAINMHGDNEAQTALTNIVTGLSVKAAFPNIDTRFHMVRIQKPVHFSHRSVSESIVYPWLSINKFDGARSGWQTRVFERPRPYLLEYDEAIKSVKEEFLDCYDAVEVRKESASDALRYLVFGQIVRRERKRVDLVVPSVSDIGTIMSHFDSHFRAAYQSKGVSRLPVLAIHSLYKLIMPELKRYNGFDLSDLELHSAADAQTGAAGDIEIRNEDGSVFEAVEIKHDIVVTVDIVKVAASKLAARAIERYYILTTAKNCAPTDDVLAEIKKIKDRTGCQVIVNGVMPTMKYYLRLVEDPTVIFVHYTEHLRTDTDIGFEHRERWNYIVLS